ncbi:MAG: nucleotide sugar dehydrogenase [Rickettsia endosymbiont of Bryobia graminum]|nr:nucleotide sugar dehydrogenase [Rickettsia endosymbiont of Bryobia graminum]
MKNILIGKIANYSATVGVIGLGYVGLPLVRAISSKNFSVIGFDVNQKKVDSLTQCKSDVTTVTNDDLAIILKQKVGFTTNFEEISKCDIIVVCVPTPLTKNREPDLSYIVKSFETISKHLKDSALLILESTTYPGTMEEVVLPLVEQIAGKKPGIFIAYSPEREDPGNLHFNNVQIPKVVGGMNQDATDLAEAFYTSFLSTIYTVSSCKVAEAVKIFENSFRLINISFVNEMKMIFDKMDIDIWEVIEAAKTKPFGFMPFYPGPGIGGHCIPIDPFYLTYKAHEYDLNTKFIETSGEILKTLPLYVVNKTAKAIDRNLLRGLHKSNILIIGLSYKENIGDMRASASIDIWNILEKRGAILEYYDPYIPEVEINKQTHTSLVFEEIDFSKYHAVLLLTNHKDIDYQKILDNSKIFVDTRNVVSNFNTNSEVKIVRA